MNNTIVHKVHQHLHELRSKQYRCWSNNMIGVLILLAMCVFLFIRYLKMI